MKNIAVLAGMVQEFYDFTSWRAREVHGSLKTAGITAIIGDDERYIYAVSVESLRGWNLDEFICIGTWYERTDKADVELVAKLQMRS